MEQITIIPASEKRSLAPERWVPAFRLVLYYGDVYEESAGKFYAQDQNLTFATQAEADAWAEKAARAWCAEFYPDWPVSI